MKYWPWRNGQIGALLLAIKAGTFDVVARLPEAIGIAGIAIDQERLRTWFVTSYSILPSELKLPAVAIHLGVKQEVVYSLVRSGLLLANDCRSGRRSEQRVGAASLTDFESRFVFCRDIATQLGRSPRAVAAFLKAEGIPPAAGPGVDGCRQLLFDRLPVESALAAFLGVSGMTQMG